MESLVDSVFRCNSTNTNSRPTTFSIPNLLQRHDDELASASAWAVPSTLTSTSMQLPRALYPSRSCFVIEHEHRHHHHHYQARASSNHGDRDIPASVPHAHDASVAGDHLGSDTFDTRYRSVFEPTAEVLLPLIQQRQQQTVATLTNEEVLDVELCSSITPTVSESELIDAVEFMMSGVSSRLFGRREIAFETYVATVGDTLHAGEAFVIREPIKIFVPVCRFRIEATDRESLRHVVLELCRVASAIDNADQWARNVRDLRCSNDRVTEEWEALAVAVTELVHELRCEMLPMLDRRRPPPTHQSLPLLWSHIEPLCTSVTFVWHRVLVPLELLQRARHQAQHNADSRESLGPALAELASSLNLPATRLSSIESKESGAWLQSVLFVIANSYASHSVERTISLRLLRGAFEPCAIRLNHWLSRAQLWDDRRWLIVHRRSHDGDAHGEFDVDLAATPSFLETPSGSILECGVLLSVLRELRDPAVMDGASLVAIRTSQLFESASTGVTPLPLRIRLERLLHEPLGSLRHVLAHALWQQLVQTHGLLQHVANVFFFATCRYHTMDAENRGTAASAAAVVRQYHPAGQQAAFWPTVLSIAQHYGWCAPQSVLDSLDRMIQRDSASTRPTSSVTASHAQLRFVLAAPPAEFLGTSTDIRGLHCLGFEYQAPFPCSMILTDRAIATYNRLHSFSAQIELCRHVLDHWQLRLNLAARNERLAADAQRRSARACRVLRVRTMLHHVVRALQSFFWAQAMAAWQQYCLEVLDEQSDFHSILESHQRLLSTIVQRCILGSRQWAIMVRLFGCILELRTSIIEGDQDETPGGEQWHVAESIAERAEAIARQFVHALQVQARTRSFLMALVSALNYNGWFDDRLAPSVVAESQ